MNVETVYEQAMMLTGDQRETLIRKLLPTVAREDAFDPEAVAAAWHQEILARLDRYDRGETVAVSADEVFARLERRFAENSG